MRYDASKSRDEGQFVANHWKGVCISLALSIRTELLRAAQMIVPLVTEKEWMAKLDSLPGMELSALEACVISPHPDDETLGAGGLIFSLRSVGTPVTVVAVTDGENAYEGEPELGLVREIEQRDALNVLGVEEQDILRLHLPDSGLSRCEAELYKAVSGIVRPGIQLIAPWSGDFHPDHEVCGRVAQRISRDRGVSLVFYFFWTWHRGELSHLEKLNVAQFPLSEDARRAKEKALACHHSQLHHHDGHPILPPDLLGPMTRAFEVYLPQ